LDGALDIISTLDSNVNDQSDPTSLDVPIDHDWDFRANAYYLYVTVFRADDASRPRFFRAEISTFEAPPENEPPEAAFSFETDGLTANFTDESTDSDGEVVAWSWEFGDDNTSTEQNPSHPYDAADTYTVTLTVTDDQDAVSEPVEDEVEVSAPPDGDVVRAFILGVSPSSNLGGLVGADAICQDSADLHAFGGTWTAWLSDSTIDARDRIPDGRYELLDGTVIAEDKADLTDGRLNAPINLSDEGQIIDRPIWTGTNADGTREGDDPEDFCGDWTSPSDPNANNTVITGVSSKFLTGQWTNQAIRNCFDAPFTIYCFGTTP
jgi:PKD repeat protein